jgi:hypothetical protein
MGLRMDGSVHVADSEARTGCGCTLCQTPLCDPAPLSVEESLRRNQLYAAQRAAWRIVHPHRSRDACE